MSSPNITKLPNDAFVRINQYLTHEDRSRITNRELYTHLHSEIYEQIQSQEENSIFRVALQRIDDKHPGWSQGVRVALVLRGVMQALQMGRYYLTSKQEQSLQIANVGWSHPDVEAKYGKKIQKSVLELCIADKNLMGKMISENRAFALISFFEDLMKKLLPEKQFELPPELPPKEQAKIIRGWMNLNRDFLSDHSEEFAFIAYVEPYEYRLPVESCMLYPKLSTHAKER